VDCSGGCSFREALPFGSNAKLLGRNGTETGPRSHDQGSSSLARRLGSASRSPPQIVSWRLLGSGGCSASKPAVQTGVKVTDIDLGGASPQTRPSPKRRIPFGLPSECPERSAGSRSGLGAFRYRPAVQRCYFFPVSRSPPPTTKRATPAHTGTFTRSFSVMVISKGPSFASWVSLV